MTEPIRNRIKSHRRVRAGDLVPHEWNFRLHPEAQKDALQALYREVGFARSLLAYELPDGRLKLIDGHLRRELSPDMEVDVEILDVTEEEARALLLSIDPLVELGRMQEQLYDRLRQHTPAKDPGLADMWEEAARRSLQSPAHDRRPIPQEIPDLFMVLVTCRDEQHQRELLARFHAEGLDCKALMS
jgi:hypothetical protein